MTSDAFSEANANVRGQATPVDRAFQLAYTVAYRLMRMYWRALRPTTHGALVALWYRGEVLLLRNSYVPYYSAPGGYLHGDETAPMAAIRELREELGVEAKPEALALALEVTHEWEGKLDHVFIFELEVHERPQVQIDHREVVAADFFTPEAALTLDVFPPLKKVIERHVSASSGA